MSLKPPVVVEVEMADRLERIDARIELRRMILSLRRSRDLHAQHDTQAATRMRQPMVMAMAATARGSEAHARRSMASSASVWGGEKVISDGEGLIMFAYTHESPLLCSG